MDKMELDDRVYHDFELLQVMANKIQGIVGWINEHEKRWDELLVLMRKGTDPTPK